MTLAAKAAQMSNEVYSALDFQHHDLHSSETRLDDRRLFRIETPGRFREMAAECDRLIAKAEMEEHRNSLREIGRAWRNVAEEAESQN